MSEPRYAVFLQRIFTSRRLKATMYCNSKVPDRTWTFHPLVRAWIRCRFWPAHDWSISQYNRVYETTIVGLLKSIQGWVMGQDHHLHSCLLHKLAPERGGRRMARLVKVIEVTRLHWFSLHLHKLLVSSETQRAAVWTRSYHPMDRSPKVLYCLSKLH